MTFSAYVQDSDGTIRKLQKGDIVKTFRNARWTYQSTSHPRKIFVTYKYDPTGPDSWPNMESREFFASVLNAGIWDDFLKIWTFTPEWDHPEDPTIFDEYHDHHAEAMRWAAMD